MSVGDWLLKYWQIIAGVSTAVLMAAGLYATNAVAMEKIDNLEAAMAAQVAQDAEINEMKVKQGRIDERTGMLLEQSKEQKQFNMEQRQLMQQILFELKK